MERLEKIPSFRVNHTALRSGIYVSQRYHCPGQESTVTTFDLRFTISNLGGQNATRTISPKAIHTIEHIGNVFLRSNPKWKDSIIYFGPMGSRTGFYLILAGDYAYPSHPVRRLVIDMCQYIIGFNGSIPGASQMECGNWREHNLSAAKYHTKRYLRSLIKYPCLKYPKRNV